MADNGDFQINDIILDIPPEQIRVDRKSVNYKWQTLRTTSSIKSKSGYSQLMIMFNVKFTDSFNGFNKLRALIAQFRVTPFCYVENEYLRNTILAGDRSTTMALALSNINITKAAQDTNVIDAHFTFYWFNYTPFTPSFSFKDEVFSSREVKDPRDSKAFKLLYEAELNRNRYLEVPVLSDEATVVFPQYASVSKTKYKQVEKDLKAMRDLRDRIPEWSANDLNDIRLASGDFLTNALNNAERAKELTEEVFGSTTSMGPEDVSKTISTIIDPSTKDPIRSLILNPEWSQVRLNDGSIPKIGATPTSQKDDGSEEQLLLQKINTVYMGPDENNIIITGISISFQNILATLPMIGHAFPTFQHIGSVDAVVNISMMTTNESAVRALSAFYTSMEEQALKYRNIPQGHRSLQIDNSFINMCGLRDFMTESFTVDTVPGQPGTYQANLELVNNPLRPDTQEDIAKESGYVAHNHLRAKVSKVLTDHLNLMNKPFEVNSPLIGSDIRVKVRDRSSKFKYTDNLDNGYYYAKVAYENYYLYNKSDGANNSAFKQLCITYGEQLGQTLVKLLDEFGRTNSFRFGNNLVSLFFTLTDENVLGIEVLQRDLLLAFKTSPLKKYLSNDYTNPFPENDPVFNKYLTEENRQQRVSDVSRQKAAIELYVSRMQHNKETYNDQQYENTRQEILSTTANIEAGITDQFRATLDDILSEWKLFSQQFIDRIILSQDLSLPQFANIQELIFNNMESVDANAYPDFPLVDIVSKLRDSDDPAFKEAIKELKVISQRARLNQKGLNVSALIGPDFYFYEHSKDSLFEIVPRYMLQEAKEKIIATHTDNVVGRDAVEKSWLEKIYEPEVIGDDTRAGKIRANISNENNDAGFWSKKENSFFLGALRSIIGDAEKQGFATNDLYDVDGQGLGCTLSEDGEVKLEAIDANETKRNNNDTILAKRPTTPMKAPTLANEAKHRFGAESIDFLSEALYQIPNPPYDPSKDPIFIKPVLGSGLLTSPFGWRTHPTTNKRQFHTGIDYAIPGKNLTEARAKSLGSPIFATAGGVIISCPRFNGDFNGNKGGHMIKVDHGNGLTSLYMHLHWDKYLEQWANIFYDVNGKKAPFNEVTENLLTVSGGQRIASMGNTGRSSGPHLHFQVEKNGTPVDPEPFINGLEVKSQGPLKDIDPRNESLLTRSTEQLEKDLLNGQGYGMIRAYPTFRFYMIESDSGERKRFGFDDFFKYSSVKSIQVVRTRKNPADLVVLELTNISGALSNKKFKSAIKEGEGTGDPSKTDTAAEHDFSSIMLQPGIQVQLRLGYNSNPEELEKLFNGVIVEVMFNETDELVTVVCQSFGIELVQNIHGEAKSFGGFMSGSGRTGRILEELMAMPEMVHFGRWQEGEQWFRSSLTKRFTINAQPEDDNIFAPTGSRGIFGLFDSTSTYILYQSTAWDVFQEMCLRHPGYVAYPVPYEDTYGSRMTMFFGLPDQLYFARNATIAEQSVGEKLKEISREAQKIILDTNKTVNDIMSPTTQPEVDSIDVSDKDKRRKKISDSQKYWIQRLEKQFAMDAGIIKPFRNYHVLTSTQHIIQNNIHNSAYNTFNTVTLQYSNDNPSDEISDATGDIQFGNLETFTLRCDGGLPDEEVREFWAQYPNCVGYEMAKRYTLGLLKDSLCEGYRGTIVVTGNPRIKPHDICYIFDEYTDMFGPIIVEQVVHKFDQNSGFVTEITPDMVVHVNQLSTLSSSDAMGLIAETALKKIRLQSLTSINSIVGNAGTGAAIGAGAAALVGASVGTAALAGGAIGALTFGPIANMFFNSSAHSTGQGYSTNPLGMVGTFIFRKLVTRSQMAHPFRYSPLVYKGRPMIGGLPIRKNGGSFIQGIQNYFNERIDGAKLLIEDSYDTITDVNKWFNPQGSFQSYTLGD